MRAHPAGDDAAPSDDHPRPTHYVFGLRGVLSDRLLTTFLGLGSRPDRGDTLLAGTLPAGALPDHAALHGVLARIEGLGLELLGVSRSRR